MHNHMRIINFNGLGRPIEKGVVQGDILILYANEEASLVKLNMLPEEYGPELIHAKNSEKLKSEMLDRIRKQYPDPDSNERHWTLECPDDIKNQAEF